MKKYALILFFVSLFQTALFSSWDRDFYVNIDSFDNQTGVYYYGVKKDNQDKRGFFFNICVYDPRDDKTVYIFPAENRERISGFFYQTGYAEELNRMLLNTDDISTENNTRAIKINYKKASQNLIITTYSEEMDLYTLWLCGKNGTGLKKLTSYNKDSDIKIDVNYNKILIIRQDRGKLVIESHKY